MTEIEEFINASDDFKKANPDLFRIKPERKEHSDMSEATFQNQVIALARSRGWLVAHFRGVRVQRKDGSVYYQTPVGADGKGFPDLVFAREGDKVIFAELKASKGRLSSEQEQWVKLTGAYVWKPEDMSEIEGVLE